MFSSQKMRRENVMLLDLGAPYSLVGKTWIRKYIEENKMKIEDLKQIKCRKRFRFRPGKVHNSEIIYELPIIVKNDPDEEEFLEMEVYGFDAMVAMLCGLNALEKWKADLKVETKKMKVKCNVESEDRCMRVNMEK